MYWGSGASVCALVVVAVVAAVITPLAAFPDGAPIEACIYGNKPNHYGTKPQTTRSSKIKFLASGSYYEPGSVLQVYISGQPFKGFFVQARDRKTHRPIGTFIENEHVLVHPECSAATHKNRKYKDEMLLIWKAPAHGAGDVMFTGTVLENYGVYWSNMVAVIPRRQG